MLHIHNGDSTANTMRESGFPGEHFAFREALASGPTPHGLSKDEWLTTRAVYLAGEDEHDTDEIKRDLALMDEKLSDVSSHEEIILWFEHDVLCQVNLVYLLDRFSRQSIGDSKLSLICIGEFRGIKSFRGLGQLTADQMATLFGVRHIVSKEETDLARKAWAAFCSDDPHSIERLLAEKTSAMPFLSAALWQHLARFPSVKNGLGHAENVLLQFIANGTVDFPSLAETFFEAEPAYGLGDLQIWSDLKRMAQAPIPLLRFKDASDISGERPMIHSSFSITEHGKRVLEGTEDFLQTNGIDLWLGGVHLREDNLWRWDGQRQALVSATI